MPSSSSRSTMNSLATVTPSRLSARYRNTADDLRNPSSSSPMPYAAHSTDTLAWRANAAVYCSRSSQNEYTSAVSNATVRMFADAVNAPLHRIASAALSAYRRYKIAETYNSATMNAPAAVREFSSTTNETSVASNCMPISRAIANTSSSAPP